MQWSALFQRDTGLAACAEHDGYSPMTFSGMTDPHIHDKHSYPEEHINIYQKREDTVLPPIFKNAFFVIENALQIQTWP